MTLRSSFMLSAALAAAVLSSGAQAADVNMVLNWVPTADHAPYFYAKQQGWYKDAGIDLTIETGRGSGAAAQRVGAGFSQIGIADMATQSDHCRLACQPRFDQLPARPHQRC